MYSIKSLLQSIAACVFALVIFTNQGICQTFQNIPNLPAVKVPEFKKDTFNIVKYGASQGLDILNSAFINKAIEDCTSQGGGTVIIPPGLWLTGPVELKSNVNLHLQKGALLQFSSNFDDYPIVKTNYEGLEAYRCKAPIYAVNATNIAVTGQGIVDGAGGAWRPVKKDKLTAVEWRKLTTSGGVLDEQKNTWYPSQKSLAGSKVNKPGAILNGLQISDVEPIKDFLRPNMVSITNCSSVLLEGVTFRNSPAWCLHPLLCQDITLRKLTVNNPWFAQNGDGVDLESCANGTIEDCTFDVGDDAICIKSGRDEQGRKRGKPTENIVIRNCIVYHGHGGFVIGSEMSGGVKNMIITNCTFIGTDIGLRFKTNRDRGGVVENIYISGIQMTNIVGEAILFDMFYGAKDPVPLSKDDIITPDFTRYPVTESTPQFKSFFIKDVICKGAARGVFVQGLPEMNVKDIYLENISIEGNQGIHLVEADNIQIKNLSLFVKENNPIKINNSKNVQLDGIKSMLHAEALVKVNGKGSSNIVLQNSKFQQNKDIVFGPEVPQKKLRKK